MPGGEGEIYSPDFHMGYNLETYDCVELLHITRLWKKIMPFRLCKKRKIAGESLSLRKDTVNWFNDAEKMDLP